MSQFSANMPTKYTKDELRVRPFRESKWFTTSLGERQE